MALMMQLWFSSSEMSTVSFVTRGTMVETMVAYADEKTMASCRPWKRARSSSSATCTSYVPLMKRTAPGPAPYRAVPSSSASMTSLRSPRPR